MIERRQTGFVNVPASVVRSVGHLDTTVVQDVGYEVQARNLDEKMPLGEGR